MRRQSSRRQWRARCSASVWLGRGEEERTRSAGEATGAGHRCGHDDLTGGDDAGVRSPPSARGLTAVDHIDAPRQLLHLLASSVPPSLV